jgi:hypothetical protein
MERTPVTLLEDRDSRAVGRLLTGQVWRRHDGRRWIYKKFIEYSE